MSEGRPRHGLFGGAGPYYDATVHPGSDRAEAKRKYGYYRGANGGAEPFTVACASATPRLTAVTRALRAYVTSLGFTGGAVWVLPNKVRCLTRTVRYRVRKRLAAYGDADLRHVE